MKLQKLFAVHFLSLALLLTGCENPSLDGVKGYGNVELELGAEASVNVAAKTRATENLSGFVLPDKNDFSLTIAGGKTAIILPSFADFDPATIFNVGNYTATAIYGNAEVEGFDHPTFAATTTFKVNHLETTSVDMVARLTNMAVTVDYTDKFQKYFADWSVTILREGESEGVYVPVETILRGDGRPVFLRPEKFYVRVDYQYTPNGNEDEDGNPIARTGSKIYEISENLDACRWIKVKVDSPNVGGKFIDVTFDDLEAVELDTIDVDDEE